MLASVSPHGPSQATTDRHDAEVRRALLALCGADVALIAAGVLVQPAYLRERESVGYLAEPLVMLGVYGVLVVLLTRRKPAGFVRARRAATLTGLALGAVEAFNIALETFGGLSGVSGLVATAPLILGPFVAWAVLAGWAARTTGSRAAGVLAGLWCALLTMVTGVTFGLVLALVTPGRLAELLVDSPEFARSGWSSVSAFVLANTFDSAFTHLLGGLVVATVVGGLGAVVGVGRGTASSSR